MKTFYTSNTHRLTKHRNIMYKLVFVMLMIVAVRSAPYEAYVNGRALEFNDQSTVGDLRAEIQKYFPIILDGEHQQMICFSGSSVIVDDSTPLSDIAIGSEAVIQAEDQRMTFHLDDKQQFHQLLRTLQENHVKEFEFDATIHWTVYDVDTNYHIHNGRLDTFRPDDIGGIGGMSTPIVGAELRHTQSERYDDGLAKHYDFGECGIRIYQEQESMAFAITEEDHSTELFRILHSPDGSHKISTENIDLLSNPGGPQVVRIIFSIKKWEQ